MVFLKMSIETRIVTVYSYFSNFRNFYNIGYINDCGFVLRPLLERIERRMNYCQVESNAFD